MNQYTEAETPIQRIIVPTSKEDSRLNAIEAELRMLRNEVTTLKRKLTRAEQDVTRANTNLANLTARITRR